MSGVTFGCHIPWVLCSYSLCLSYAKWGIFIEDLPFNKLFVLLFVASAKQNRLANIKVSQKRIIFLTKKDNSNFHKNYLNKEITWVRKDMEVDI
jgi:hypothetical protein